MNTGHDFYSKIQEQRMCWDISEGGERKGEKLRGRKGRERSRRESNFKSNSTMSSSLIIFWINQGECSATTRKSYIDVLNQKKSTSQTHIKILRMVYLAKPQ